MATPPETQTRPDTQTGPSTSFPIEAEKMRRRIAGEVDVPVHTKAETISYELKETGMNETTADTIGNGFKQVAGAVSGLGNIFTDGFETLLQHIDDVSDGLNKRMDTIGARMDKLEARMDKMDENNRAEHRANRMFMLGILGLFTTVFLTVGGGMFVVLNSKIDANTALIRENSEKIDKLDDKVDALDAKVERILGILEARQAQ